MGFEVELSQKVNKTISWYANYTYMKTNIINDLDDDQDGGTVPFSPNHIANTGFTISTDFGLKFVPSASFVGKYYDSSSKTNRGEFNPGVIVNAFISQTVAKKDNFNLDIFAKAYNLTNNTYEMPWQFQNTGLAVSGGVKIIFK